MDPWVGEIAWRRESLPTPVFLGLPCGSAGKESAFYVEDMSMIPARMAIIKKHKTWVGKDANWNS